MGNWNNGILGRQNSLHKKMVATNHKEFFLPTEVEGMVENRKQDQQRRLNHEELVGTYRCYVTRLPSLPGNILIHVCCSRIIINVLLLLSNCPSLDNKIHDLRTYREKYTDKIQLSREVLRTYWLHINEVHCISEKLFF